MKLALNLLRPSSYYRSDAFNQGLRRHGFDVVIKANFQPSPNDVLLMWNRREIHEKIIQRFERVGARIIVAENGYLPDPRSQKSFALALDNHNGAGRWYAENTQRFDIPEEPWRKSGGHVLLLPQRGIGPKGVAMPSGWITGVRQRLERITDREIRIRKHPGATKTDPYEDLQGAHCAVTWASGAAIKAIRFGTPVFYEFNRWIGQFAATKLAESLEQCNTGDRSELWKRLTWAQWSLEEIETGEAMDRLLHAENRSFVCAK